LAGTVAIREDRLHPVPPGLESSVATLAEPLAVAVHAVSRVCDVSGRVVVVVGGGPVGILLAHVARRAGAHVSLAEPSPDRRAMAADLGLELLDVADPVADVRARTDGRMAAIAMDAAAAPTVAAMLTELVHPGGTIAIVGSYGRPVPVDLQAVMFRELSIMGHRTYLPRDIDGALAMLAADQHLLRRLITDVVSPNEVGSALQAMTLGRVMKVVVECPA
jgi:2-desacetyl-2-hydroxyethyl bacteriochlorophyllide A dehydrogenase